MVFRLPVIHVDGDVDDLSNVDSSQFKPAETVLPIGLMKKLGVRGSQKAPTKERITVRLSPDVEPWNKLKAGQAFYGAFIENGTVIWQGNIDIDPETLYERSVPLT